MALFGVSGVIMFYSRAKRKRVSLKAANKSASVGSDGGSAAANPAPNPAINPD
jgi:hypothetical protein